MNKSRAGRLRRWPILLCAIYMVFILTACGSETGRGISAEYQGVKYTGNGSLTTMVAVAIHSEEEIMFVQLVKIIDDHPTVWKALKAVSDNEEQGVLIEKDQEGHIIKVDGQENNAEGKWSLYIENVLDDGNVEELEIREDEAISLRYDEL